MAKLSKLAVQYLLNDEPQEEHVKRPPSHRQHRSHHRSHHGRLLTQVDQGVGENGGCNSEVDPKEAKYSSDNESINFQTTAIGKHTCGSNSSYPEDSVLRRSRKNYSLGVMRSRHDPSQSISAALKPSAYGDDSGQRHLISQTSGKYPSSPSSTHHSAHRPHTLASSASLQHHTPLSAPSSPVVKHSSQISIPSSPHKPDDHAEQNRNSSEARQFRCEICAKSFVERGNLNKHISSVHLKEKPKTCTEPGCDKSFSFRDGLRRHIAHVHQNQRSHACAICQKRFKQASHLAKHMRTIHKQTQ